MRMDISITLTGKEAIEYVLWKEGQNNDYGRVAKETIIKKNENGVPISGRYSWGAEELSESTKAMQDLLAGVHSSLPKPEEKKEETTEEKTYSSLTDICRKSGISYLTGFNKLKAMAESEKKDAGYKREGRKIFLYSDFRFTKERDGKTIISQDGYYTIEEARDITGRSKWCIYGALRSKSLKGAQGPDLVWQINEDDLNEWVKKTDENGKLYPVDEDEVED